MHPRFERADALSAQVMGAAIEAHREVGPGLVDSIYERCLLPLRLVPVGLLFNFYESVLRDDVVRLILPGANDG